MQDQLNPNKATNRSLEWSANSDSPSFGKTYLTQTFVATALLIIVLPYVLLTNFTATYKAITIHGLLYWALIPGVVSSTRAGLHKIIKTKFGSILTADIITEIIGISIAAGLMTVIFHEISNDPYRVLLSPFLWAAIAPIYVGYIVFNLARAWRRQRNITLKLELAQTKAAWQALSAQIKPHFLFNSLTMLEQLIETSPVTAKESVRHLAGLYRQVLQSSSLREIDLETEIKTISHYIFIQELRFSERLNFELNVPDNLLKTKIPPNILLNCVENGLKYGIEPSSGLGTIEVSAEENNGNIFLTVKSPNLKNKKNSTSKDSESTKFGHKYIKEQLQIIYGKDNWSFELVKDKKYFHAKLVIPVSKKIGASA